VIQPKVKPGPYAPLLMRIVRYPFALQPGATVRSPAREPRAAVERETLGRPGAAWRELRADLAFRNPVRSIAHRPEPRPRPKALARDASGGEP
jgi:hypothetical protein